MVGRKISYGSMTSFGCGAPGLGGGKQEVKRGSK